MLGDNQDSVMHIILMDLLYTSDWKNGNLLTRLRAFHRPADRHLRPSQQRCPEVEIFDLTVVGEAGEML